MTGQEITVRPAAQVGTLTERMEYAKALAHSGLLPDSYRGQPANLLWAIEYGQSIGVSPMAAITGVHVIKGKPTASAQLIAGLVRRAGHTLRVSGDETSATAQIIRRDDPGYTYESRWTLDRARTAKLTGKDTWQQYPASMLKSRAITEVARDACSEVLSGLLYTPEELGAVVDEDGAVVDATPPPAAPEPTPEPPARDWLAEAAQVTTRDQARALWREAATADALTPQLSDLLAAAAEDATVDKATGEIVEDAELVDAPTQATTEWPDVPAPGGEAA